MPRYCIIENLKGDLKNCSVIERGKIMAFDLK